MTCKRFFRARARMHHLADIGAAWHRAVTRSEEELSPYLPPSKRSYVFGSLAAQAARFIMWLLPELRVCA